MAIQETRMTTTFLRDHPDDSFTIEAALANGAYEMLPVAFGQAPDDIVKTVQDSGLRGKGGAGFSTGQKWSFLPKDVFPRYLAVNADEGEPATFKDHMLLERDPHQLIEGIVIAAYAIQAHHAFIYMRGEFALGADRVRQALADAYAHGFVGKNIQGSGFDLEIVLHRGAGCYIAGDETALLSSLEGERAMPRIKPPFPAAQGVYASPTIVNNVETLSTVPHILRHGAEWHAAMGIERSRGTRIFSLAGHVERPGNYEVEMGITFRDLIEGLGGGMKDGAKMGFFIPGGASSPWLLEEHLDVALDIDYVQTQLTGATTMLGSGAVTVFDDTVDPLLIAWRIAKFFAHESCGKCTPCREGSGWIEKVLYRMLNGQGRPEDLDLLLSFGNNIAPGLDWPPGQTTICPLGPSTVSPMVSLNRWWRDEIIERMARDTEARRAIEVQAMEVSAAAEVAVS
ncbi:MAG: NADH-quinone oxidoreductase subunit NuoF [Acidimicrobiia bacterium]